MSVPAPLPRAEIRLAGQPLADEVAATVSGLWIRQVLNAPTVCEITLADPPAHLVDDPGLQPDRAVRVDFAQDGAPSFDGRLVAVEHAFQGDAGRRLHLRAYDRLHHLRRSRHLRVLAEPTLHALAQTLAGPAGLRVEGGEDAELPRQSIQHRQSDLQCLVDQAGRCGHYLACDGDTLRLIRLPATQPPLELDREAGRWEARFERTLVGDAAATETAGWDAGTLERRTGRWGTQATSGDDAPTLWRTNRVLRSGQAPTQDARAEMERRDAGRLVVWATGLGDPRIRPGRSVRLRGFGAPFEVPQTVTDAEHTLDERSGYLTEFNTDPPRLPASPEPTEVTVARVVDSDDPDGAGRVRVALEAFGDVSTDWLPVLVLGAGAHKGLTIHPEVDDLVLVLLCGADPSAGIVLGGLYGGRPGADPDVAGRRPRPYTLRTPGGQRVRLDDHGQLVRLENADGSYLALSAEEVVLHAARDLRIEAPGRTLTLGADAIDMRSR